MAAALSHVSLPLFEQFRPLIRPLSGVNRMCLLKKGDKEIFVIGETHQQKFCRHQGFTPLSQIIEEFLTNTLQPVDFMMEDFNHPELYENLSAEVRQISNEHENRGIKKDEDATTLMNLTRLLLKHSTFQNARVHWLDVDIFDAPFDGPRRGTLLMHLFYKFTKKTTPDEQEEARSDIDDLLRIRFGVEPPWRDPQSFESTDLKKIQLLFYQCYNALQFSKYLRKCYGEYSETRDTPPTFFTYWEAYISAHDLELSFTNIYLVYFNLQRFFMDMYTCCRIMKKEAHWYKNIVIYAGDWHVQNFIAILTRPEIGFVQHELPINVEYNPKCFDKREESEPKRKKGGSRRRTRRFNKRLTR